mmetsp:Transcript_27143/g.62968  ORF Transcript_27143/g.62968 Transcript_27143/m.62968 type:complete len:107 (+) Transcript_27143:423-743(+)
MHETMGQFTASGSIPFRDELKAFAKAATQCPWSSADEGEVRAARDRVREVVGEHGLIDACGASAAFHSNTRIVDAGGMTAMVGVVQVTVLPLMRAKNALRDACSVL